MYHLARSLYLYATSKEEYSVLLLGLDNAGKTTLLSQIRAIYSAHDDSSSSSSTSSLFSTSQIGKTVPTVGQNVATINLPDMYVKIWDVGGQISMRGLWQSYYASCHAIVFVVDSSDLGDGADLAFVEGLMLPGSTGRRRSSALDSAAAAGGGGVVGDEDGDAEEDGTDEGRGGGGGGGGGGKGGLAGSSSASTGGAGRLDECRQVLESVLQHSDAAGVPVLVLANKQDREDCVEVVRIKEGLVRKIFEGEKGGGVRDSRVLPVSALRGTGVKEAVEWVRSRVKWNKEGRPPVMR